MSKIFYDHLVVFDDLGSKVKDIAEQKQERHELYKIIDEIIHHRVVGCILDKLPEHHHDEFIEKFKERPHDEGHIHFVNDRIEDDIEKHIRKDMERLEKELLEELADL